MDLNLVNNVNSKGRYCLVIKLLTRKYFNQKAFKAMMKRIWKPLKSIHFYEMGVGLILVEFEEFSDKRRVVRDEPQNFDKCIILVQEFEGGKQVKHIQMTVASL